MSAETVADATGRWAVCLRGAEAELDAFTVRAAARPARGGATTGAVSLGVGERGVARLDLTVAAPAPGAASPPTAPR